MTIFKLASEIVAKQFSEVLKGLEPCKLTTYEGVMAGAVIYNTPLFAGDFECVNCGCKLAYTLLHNSKKYLCCASQSCINANSNRTEPYVLPKLGLSDCNVPEILKDASFQKCDQSEEIKFKTKEFSKKHNGFCLIHGQPGRGKSYLATCMLKEFLENERDGFFISQSELNQKWLQLSSTGTPTLSLLDTLQSKKMLILDDIGCMKFTESFGDFMFMLVEKRRNSPGLATIITTNLTGAKMNELLGSAFVSRIATGLNIKIEGNDKRRSF